MSPLIAAPDSGNLLLGKGKVYFNRKVGAALTGYRHLGNVERFELTTNDDVLEKFSSMSAPAPLYKSVTRRRNVSLNLTLDEFDPENVALVLMGTVALSTQAATPIVDEIMSTSSLLGRTYRTAKLGPITAVTVEKSPATALTAGVDYVIDDANLGLIRIISNTILTDGSTILVTYTPTAYTAGTSIKTIEGGVQTLIEGAVLFVPDPTLGPKQMVEVWSVSSRPDGALGLISDEFAQAGLVMAVQDDSVNHPTSPLYRVTLLA